VGVRSRQQAAGVSVAKAQRRSTRICTPYVCMHADKGARTGGGNRSTPNESTPPVPAQMGRGVSPVPAQMGCGVGPVPAQMWRGVGPVPAQMGRGVGPVPAQMWHGVGPVPACEASRGSACARTVARCVSALSCPAASPSVSNADRGVVSTQACIGVSLVGPFRFASPVQMWQA
jgi:hypothetical protein